MDAVSASAAETGSAIVSYDGGSLAVKEEEQLHITAVDSEVPLLDLLATEEVPERIYWPIEQLLVRSFSLPLAEPRLIDAAILAQEVAELTGEEEEDWWLSWHAGKRDDGVAGLLIGLPQDMRRDMQQRPLWQQCPNLLVDGWERLQFQRAGEANCALIDEDADGIFFGFISDGVWRGIRRLNRRIADEALLSNEAAAKQILYSWRAMGVDAESCRVLGRAGAGLCAGLAPGFAQWEVSEQEILPDRHQANFATAGSGASALNIRHGKWVVRRQWRGLAQWKRPLAMVAGLLLIWMAATGARLWLLERQVDDYQARIMVDFHRGLPNEPAVDPLAQLRRAAGSSVENGRSFDLLHQLQLLSDTWRETSWELNELNYEGGGAQMSGSAADIDSLNKIRDRLGKAIGREVTISDTDLSGGRVSFRMKW